MKPVTPVPSAILFVVLATGILLTYVAPTVLTPLWLDSVVVPFVQTNVTYDNRSESIHAFNITLAYPTYRRVDSYTLILLVNIIYIIYSGVILGGIKIVKPSKISEKEKNYPKFWFVLIGLADSFASIFFVYAGSGSRTAPYLQAVAYNFTIPVTFIVRFLLLRKRPTRRKILCAAAVLLAEFIALIPSIFPDLENSTTHKEEGGAQGIGGVLWPFCYFLGWVPTAVVNTLTEKTMQDEVGRSRTGSVEGLNVFFVLFWSFVFHLLFVLAFFWTDIIPGFGMASSIQEFGQLVWFNLKCFIGLSGCGSRVVTIAILCITTMIFNRLLRTLFMRYFEGANYLVITASLQTPVTLLFWTLFDEKPFHWHPHIHLSTWLSIGAVCIMLPAIYFYNTGSPEMVPPQMMPKLGITNAHLNDDEATDDDLTQPLLQPLESDIMEQ